jgi:hypothetical protein
MNLDRLRKPDGSGLWLTAAPWTTLKALERSDGPVVRVVRGRKCATKQGLLDEWSAAFQFGHHFGENWDALLDCLRDAHALPRGLAAIVLDAVHVLGKEPADELTTLAGVLGEAVKRWRHPGPGHAAGPFCVVLQCRPAEEASVRARWKAAGAVVETLA